MTISNFTLGTLVENSRKATKDRRYQQYTQVFNIRCEPKKRNRKKKNEVKPFSFNTINGGIENPVRFPTLVNAKNSSAERETKKELPAPIKILKSHSITLSLSSASTDNGGIFDITSGAKSELDDTLLPKYAYNALNDLNLNITFWPILKAAEDSFFNSETLPCITKKGLDDCKSTFLVTSIWLFGLSRLNTKGENLRFLMNTFDSYLIQCVSSSFDNITVDLLKSYYVCLALTKMQSFDISKLSDIIDNTFQLILNWLILNEPHLITNLTPLQKLEMELVKSSFNYNFIIKSNLSQTVWNSLNYVYEINYPNLNNLYLNSSNIYQSNQNDNFLDHAIIIRAAFISHLISQLKFILSSNLSFSSLRLSPYQIQNLNSLYQLYFNKLKQYYNEANIKLQSSSENIIRVKMLDQCYKVHSNYMLFSFQYFLSLFN